jgi:anti-anti-sigma factor
MSGELATLAVQERGEIVIATVAGELDVSVAPAIGDEIATAVPTSARALVVDFTQLSFIDSSGIAMLFSLARRLSSRRQELTVVAPGGEGVARVLELVEFSRAAPIHRDLDSALAELG